MRKPIRVASLAGFGLFASVVVQFLTDIAPLWIWPTAAFLCLCVTALTFVPEMKAWLRKRGLGVRAHSVAATPAHFHFSTSRATGSTTPPPLLKRVSRLVASCIRWVSPQVLISLSEAGQIAFNELEDTEWGEHEYGLNKHDPVRYYCHALLREKEAEVFGIRPKATKLRRLDINEVRRGFLSDGGKHLLGHGYEAGGEREVLFENLHIHRRLLYGFLKARRAQ